MPNEWRLPILTAKGKRIGRSYISDHKPIRGCTCIGIGSHLTSRNSVVPPTAMNRTLLDARYFRTLS